MSTDASFHQTRLGTARVILVQIMSVHKKKGWGQHLKTRWRSVHPSIWWTERKPGGKEDLSHTPLRAPTDPGHGGLETLGKRRCKPDHLCHVPPVPPYDKVSTTVILSTHVVFLSTIKTLSNPDLVNLAMLTPRSLLVLAQFLHSEKLVMTIRQQEVIRWWPACIIWPKKGWKKCPYIWSNISSNICS